MPHEIETMIRTSAPRVTLDPDSFLAALDVSDEAAATIRTAAKRRRFGWVIGGATVVALAVGTNAAAAATQTLWWSAPHAVTEQMAPATNSVTPVKSVRYTLSAGFAPGADGGSAKAKAAFQLAQDWLAAHPVVVTVPKAAQTLTGGEKSKSIAQGEPAQIELDHKAIQATQDQRDASLAAGHDALVADLDAYLSSHGVDPALIVVDSTTGLLEVGH